MALNISGETLDTLPPPTAPVDMGSQTVQNIGDPVNTADAATSQSTNLRVFTNDFVLPGNSSRVFVDFLQVNGGASATIPGTSTFYIEAPPQAITPTVTTVKAPADFTTSSVALVSVQGLSLSLAQNKTYEVDVLLLGNTSTTSGSNFSIAYSGSMVTNSTFLMTANTSSTAVSSSGAVIGNASAATFWTGANQESEALMWAVIRTSTTGILSVKILCGSGISTVRAGSRMTVTTLA